jgi:predicted Zn-dependent protease
MACLETIPYTGRRHSIMFVSRQQEQALGKIVFDMQREEARQNQTLLPDYHRYSKLVRAVGMRVAQVASSEDFGTVVNLQHMKGLQWDFAVIQSPVPNAFVVPGGKVVVFTGLLNLLNSEDELAAVLAHETAHVLARHHAERMSTMNLITLIRLLFYALVGLSVPQSALYLGVFLPYSRLAEHEADYIGLRLMARACHNPEACISMLSKLGEKEHQMERNVLKVPAFFSTHPLTNDRVQRVKKEMKEALKMYDLNCSARRDSMMQSVERAWRPSNL